MLSIQTDTDRIIHVFMGRRHHHAPGMIETILNYSSNKHYFVIYFTEDERCACQIYIDLFSKYKHGFFEICFVPRFKTLVQNLFRFKGARNLITSLHYVLFTKRKNPILFHGEFSFRRGDKLLLLLFSPYFRSLSWVCWGDVPGRVAKSNRPEYFLSKIRQKSDFEILSKIFNKFGRIICLMEGDKNEFESRFRLDNISLLPYPNEQVEKIKFTNKLNHASHLNQCRVLVGNSILTSSSYTEVIEILAKFSKKIRLMVMLSYGNRTNELEILIKNATAIYADNFIQWAEQLPLDQYINRINEHDIYICNWKTQTGLAAIYYCLVLGKKIYLTGYNYKWIKSCGFIVKNVSEIVKEDFKTFSAPLTSQEKKHNFDLFEEKLGYKKTTKDWETLYYSLLT